MGEKNRKSRFYIENAENVEIAILGRAGSRSEPTHFFGGPNFGGGPQIWGGPNFGGASNFFLGGPNFGGGSLQNNMRYTIIYYTMI